MMIQSIVLFSVDGGDTVVSVTSGLEIEEVTMEGDKIEIKYVSHSDERREEVLSA